MKSASIRKRPKLADAPMLFKLVHLQPDSAEPTESHAEGQFVHALAGVIEVGMEGQILLAPPQYGIWIPPHLEHVSSNHHAASYVTVYVAEHLCEALPRNACTMVVNPLMQALLSTFRTNQIEAPRSLAEQRLFEVLLDQLIAAPNHQSYLPTSQDPQLSRVLTEMQSTPWDNRSLAEWALSVHTTERTLARRCERDLHMPFSEWRQRLKVLRGIALLESGRAVKDVALELGYSAPSAFIKMFSKHVGVTPQAYTQNRGG